MDDIGFDCAEVPVTEKLSRKLRNGGSARRFTPRADAGVYPRVQITLHEVLIARGRLRARTDTRYSRTPTL